VTDAGDFHQRCVRAAALGLLGGGPHVDRLDLKKGLRRMDFEKLPPDRARDAAGALLDLARHERRRHPEPRIRRTHHRRDHAVR